MNQTFYGCLFFVENINSYKAIFVSSDDLRMPASPCSSPTLLPGLYTISDVADAIATAEAIQEAPAPEPVKVVKAPAPAPVAAVIEAPKVTVTPVASTPIPAPKPVKAPPPPPPPSPPTPVPVVKAAAVPAVAQVRACSEKSLRTTLNFDKKETDGLLITMSQRLS